MNKPMCLHPWNNIDIALDGNIMPCCKWPAKLPGKKFNIHDATGIDDYRNSPMLQDLKTKLSNHEWHDGCYRCRQDEGRNGPHSRKTGFAVVPPREKIDRAGEDDVQKIAGLAFADQFDLRREILHVGTAQQRQKIRLRHLCEQVECSNLWIVCLRHVARSASSSDQITVLLDFCQDRN